jgi:hypothetical protein
MTYRRPCDRSFFSTSDFFPSASKIAKLTATIAIFLATLLCLAQQQPATKENPDSQSSQMQAGSESATVTIPAGTRIALVLTQPIQTRYVRRGDDIYAQVTSPVNSGNEVVIPPGTFVQGKVDKLGRKGGRAELRLQSMSITFPDGYVAPISGPVTLETGDGYAWKDPGNGRSAGAFALPLAGAGLGALIGHATASSQGSTITSTLPGCTGPGCTSSVTGPADTGRNAIIGAGIGGAIGAVASLALIFGGHNFFIDVGAPIEMTLNQPVVLQQNEVGNAVRESEEHPASLQPVEPRPLPPPPPDMPVDHGTCYTPGTPGTPDTVIPGVPGPDGVPGPPTIIPGTPPTPGTPYPCP